MNSVQLIGNIIKKGSKKLPYIAPKMTDMGTRELPEYLYHFTSVENVNNIVKTGKLLTTDGVEVTGVFMLDLDNFIKNWPKLVISNECGSFNFFNALFSQVTKGDKRIACFRIPTSHLDRKLVIRDQNNLIEASEKANLGEDISSLAAKVDDAGLYKIYHQKGHGVEFIHIGEIKIDKNNLVGTAELPQEFTDFVPGKEPLKSCFDTLRYLFIKQPESKLLEGI